MSIQRPTNYSWAFAQRKQSDVFTAISAGSLDKSLPYTEFNPALMEKEIYSDRLYIGKGHDFSSRVDQLSQRFRFGRTFDATSESIAYALSLLMGKVSTTGPVSTIYSHVVEFESPLTMKECMYTTVIEKAGSEYQKLISGVFMESVSLTAEGKQNLKIAFVASGRTQIDNATSLPAITKSVVFRSNHATFQFGATGAQVGISESVTKWNLTLAQNPDVRWMPGQTSGEEKYLRYALVGAQTIGGSISFFLNSTLRDLFQAHSQCGVTILCKGVDNVNHELKIEIPCFQISSEAQAVSGQTTELTLAFNEDSVIKDDAVSGSPIKITLKNEISALLQ